MKIMKYMLNVDRTELISKCPHVPDNIIGSDACSIKAYGKKDLMSSGDIEKEREQSNDTRR